MAGILSLRGAAVTASQAEGNAVWDVISHPWHPVLNPTGYVSLGVAENALMHEELCEYLTNNIPLSPKALTYGDGPNGSMHLRAVMAHFITTHFKTAQVVQPEHIMVTAGVSAAVEHLSWAVTNPGEGILLGRPYYRTFLADIGLRTGVGVVPVSFGKVDPCGTQCVTKYEEVMRNSNTTGVPIRALMLCHPHNPLGRCYSKQTLIALMKLCQKYQVHLISDEIYALSVWQNKVDTSADLVGFQSVLSIDTRDIIDPRLVHVLWGMSKDFGANGIRIGAIISQGNPELLAACRSCGLYSSPSSLAEEAAVMVLNNPAFVERYIKANRERLSQAYSYAIGKLNESGIEYAPGATAGFFIWVNLGKAYLQLHPEEHYNSGLAITKVVFEKLMMNKVYIVSGDVTGAEEPGWFRLIFTQPRELVDEGIRRIVGAIDELSEN
ncbi:aminotransferase [Delitschia confertaspora ATCC 74209]|uniref:Aminotransferase n=1 Tax=Delitschia confertaspora ATCC 74209 TaxID=1513339 RepID=A0A9P4MXF1_9PLEO|nr:aminotransferase [Delitschia confertaspora ATCC 74209]